MMRPRTVIHVSSSLAFLATGSPGCRQEAEPRPQWTISIETDAPVPLLGDRVLVEVLDASGEIACDGCRRILSAPRGTWPLSFGIVPGSAGPLRARARLHRTDEVEGGGLPAPTLTIDALGELAGEPGLRRLQLHLECSGVAADPLDGTTCDPAIGSAVPIAPLPGRDHASLVEGTSPLAITTPCAVPAAEGMVCVPGGIGILGGGIPALAVLPDGAVNAAVETRPRVIVRVSPFHLDARELTVRAVRALLDAERTDLRPALRSDNPLHYGAACNFTPEAGDREDHPVNCISMEAAEAYCKALEKRLPTEAEWELAAGRGAQKTDYPWGNDGADVCGHAVLARGRVNVLGGTIESTDCLVGEWGTVSVLEATGDVGLCSPGENAPCLLHLGGNVAERVSTRGASYADACFRAPFAPLDPRCDDPGLPLVVRGGSWSDVPAAASSTTRIGLLKGDELPWVGVRCARDP
jgi:formylglycine-generating enzyme